MSPRLQAVLLTDRRSETPAPPIPRKSLDDINLGVRVDETWVPAHVVIDRRQLDELAQEGDLARRPEVLVADHGLCHRLGL